MKEQVKKIWEEHKKAVIIGGVVVGVVVTAMITKQVTKRTTIQLIVKKASGYSGIMWKKGQGASPVNLDKVKELLELNKDNLSSFAIYRQAHQTGLYTVIALDDSFVEAAGTLV